MRLFTTFLFALIAVAGLAVGPSSAQVYEDPEERPQKPDWKLAPEGEITRAEIEVSAETGYDGRYQLTENLQIYLFRSGETWNVDAMRSEEVTASPGAGGEWTKSVSRQASIQSRELAEKLLDAVAELAEEQRMHDKSTVEMSGENGSAERASKAENAGEDNSEVELSLKGSDRPELEMSRELRIKARLFKDGDEPETTLDTGQIVRATMGMFVNRRSWFANRMLATFSFRALQAGSEAEILTRWRAYPEGSNQRNVRTSSNYSSNYESEDSDSGGGEDSGG